MMIYLVWLLTVLNPMQATDPLEQYRAGRDCQVGKYHTETWRNSTKSKPIPNTPKLFVGSSSIVLWKDIAQDMAPYATIRRGFGGSKFSDVAVYIDRLVKPHQFDAVALFVANDISGSKTDKTPEEVLRLVDITVNKIKEHGQMLQCS
ncbi:MAG: hypothetical protein R3C56_09695 [Pirellulaceae bacterium]